jgi:alpha-glucosidase
VNLALMLTMKGTPFLYNGEEIGMSDYLFTDVERFRDLMGLFYYHLARQHPEMIPPEEAPRVAAEAGRDKSRTPMHWSNAVNGGFSPEGVEPWLPVNPNYAQGVNVADQQGDPGSMLNFYRRLLQVRRENPGLIDGEYEALGRDSTCLAFIRQSPRQTCLVVLNMSETPRTLRLGLPGDLRLVYSSHRAEGTAMNFSPFEIFIAEVLS